jgi:4-hydroxymandelate oxidase
VKTIARRQFLNFLAASPLIAAASYSRLAHGASTLPPFLIESPGEALDVFDLHDVAKNVLPTSHYGYLATGTDGNQTLVANREAFEKIYLRAMRMVDTQHIDTQTELLGTRMKSPIVIAPVGSQNAFHAEGELATARAARTHDTLQILSNVSTHSIEDVSTARGAPVGFQIYPTNDWSIASTMLKRAEKAGAQFVVLTVDLNSASNRVLLGQYIRADERDCSACHDAGPDAWLQSKPMYSGTGATTAGFDNASMTWEFVERLKAATTMKVVVKGIVTAEDAILCVRHGADAVCIGRAYIWGLAAFGQPGVEKVIEILNAELRMVMGQMGTPSLADIGRQHIGVRSAGIG